MSDALSSPLDNL